MIILANINKIKELCKEKGISQTYISKKLGLAPSYLTDVANGKNTISPERLSQIADILGTTTDYLEDKSDEKNVPVVRYDRHTREFISRYEQLSPDQKKLVDALLAELSKD